MASEEDIGVFPLRFLFSMRTELPACVIPFNCGMQMKDDTFNEETLREVAALGFKFVRRGFYWAKMETVKGVYDFSSVDPQMALCRELGLTVIVTLFSCNTLYEDNGKGGVETEEGRRGFAAFGVACAKHYADQPVMFEIWNEPNVRTFWHKDGMHNSPEFAREYSDLVLEVAPAMVRAVPDVFIIGGSVSNYWEPAYQWTEECFKLGVLASGIRAWSTHPYGVKTPEEFKVGHDRMKALLVKYGAPDMPLLDTERGFSATERAEGYSGGDEAQILEYQAWYFVRQFMVDMIEDVRLTNWYEYRGSEGFAMHNPDGSERPALLAWKEMLRELGGYRFDRVLSASPLDRFALFVNDATGARKLVAWTCAPAGETPDKTAPHEAPVTLPSGERRVLALTGRPQYVQL